MMRTNRLKARLKAGEQSYCGWSMMGNAMAAEIMALAGVDAIVIDHEHGPADLMSAIGIMQAVSGTDATTIMRVPSHDPVYVKRALDAGIEGIMFPSVNTVDQARAAVSACRYPPNGKRGAAYSYVRASDYGLNASDYPAHADDNVVILAQVESKTALENLDEISQVDGIDGFYMGPLDMSGSIGKLGQFQDDEVAGLLAAAEDGVLKSGKALGGSAGGQEAARKMRGRGYTLIGIGADIDHIRDGVSANLENVRRN
ncbi:MAG: hypothetical protein CL569_14370 [Alphaproteobacteria bacterium]|nr:hypothetical protein [Alphaproteobacteria bacterium]|tara:strand:+ start:5276 stop:6046 length:771 start_codon:yes stop_codon:yes gene_type:complete